MGPLIAIIGTDGSGKSTLCDALLAWLQEKGPAELCHLGIQSGNIARAIGRLPIVGKKIEHAIDGKVKKAEGIRGPGFLESIGIHAFTLRRLARFRRMLKLRETGAVILADRYPQITLPEGVDGPGFGRFRTDKGIAKWLAPRERRHYEWMAAHPPDLVLRLNVDLDTAMLRKPDHSRERLASRIADLPKLGFGNAPIVDIDAAKPADQVLADAKEAISTVLRCHEEVRE